MTQYMVITAIGQDRPGIVQDVTRVILDNNGNITNSRMAVLGGEFALLILVNGAEDAIEKIEIALKSTQSDLGLDILFKKTKPTHTMQLVSHQVNVESMDHPGIVHRMADYFTSRTINIEEMVTGSHAAAHTGTQMFSLEMHISLPADISLENLREEFTAFCNELNLDGKIG